MCTVSGILSTYTIVLYYNSLPRSLSHLCLHVKKWKFLLLQIFFLSFSFWKMKLALTYVFYQCLDSTQPGKWIVFNLSVMSNWGVASECLHLLAPCLLDRVVRGLLLGKPGKPTGLMKTLKKGWKFSFAKFWRKLANDNLTNHNSHGTTVQLCRGFENNRTPKLNTIAQRCKVVSIKVDPNKEFLRLNGSHVGTGVDLSPFPIKWV